MRVFLSLIATMALLNAGAAAAGSHVVVQNVGTTASSLKGGTMPAWGSTPLEIGNMFPGVMLAAFKGPNCSTPPCAGQLNGAVSHMDDFMLARFSTELIAHDPNYVDIPAIFKLAAVALDVNNLLRMAAAFGPSFMATYAVPYMTAQVRPNYEELVSSVTPLLQSHWWALKGGVLPDQPTAGTGGATGTTNGVMGDLYAYDVFLDAYMTQDASAFVRVVPQIPIHQALATAGKYMHIVHVQNGEVDKSGLFDVIIVLAAVFAIAESKTAASVTDWLGQVLGQAYADATAQPEIELPSPIDPFPDEWDTPWDGGWDDNVVCVTDGDKCLE